MEQQTICHSNPPWGDIENGIYIDKKKRLWNCTLEIGRWIKPYTKQFDAQVSMKFEQEEKIVTTGEFRTFTKNKLLIKFK